MVDFLCRCEYAFRLTVDAERIVTQIQETDCCPSPVVDFVLLGLRPLVLGMGLVSIAIARFDKCGTTRSSAEAFSLPVRHRSFVPA